MLSRVVSCLPGEELVEVYIVESSMKKHRILIKDNNLLFKAEGDEKALAKKTKIDLFAAEDKKDKLMKSQNSEYWIDKSIQRICKANSKFIRVRELFSTYRDYPIFINTPEGFVELGTLYKKGIHQIYSISFTFPDNREEDKDSKLRCADTHFLMTKDYIWCPANELKVGDIIMSKNGLRSVFSIEINEKALVYDFEVLHANHRYYAGKKGIVSHNSD